MDDFSFRFDPLQLLRMPLHEQVHFSELTADWVLLTLERLMPPWWEVNGAHYLPGVTREKMGGRFDPANYFYFRVIVGEVVVEPGVRWVACNGYGELDNDKCETVMICEAMREPGRWQLDMICYMEYAGGTFHELVQRLREAGGQLVRQSPKVGGNRKKPVDRHVFSWKQRRDIVNEYYRQVKEEKINQDQFAAQRGISGRTLRRWIEEFPADTDGHGQQA